MERPDDFDGPDFAGWLAQLRSWHGHATKTLVGRNMDPWASKLKGNADGSFTLLLGRRSMEVLAEASGVSPIAACEYPPCVEPQHRGIGVAGDPPIMVKLCHEHYEVAKRRVRVGRKEGDSDGFYNWYLSMAGVHG